MPYVLAALAFFAGFSWGAHYGTARFFGMWRRMLQESSETAIKQQKQQLENELAARKQLMLIEREHQMISQAHGPAQ